MTALALALFACEFGDPGFYGGGNSANRDNPDETGDTGTNDDPPDDTPVIDEVAYAYEDLPNSQTGCLLNLCYEYRDRNDDLDGGRVWVEFEGLGDGQTWDIGSNDARILDEEDRGCDIGDLYLGFDIDNDDYEVSTTVKDSAGNKSEVFELSIVGDDNC